MVVQELGDWTWGCATVFARARRLLAGDSVQPGHQSMGEAQAEPAGALGLPGTVAQVAGDEPGRLLPVPSPAWEDRAFPRPGKYFRPLCRPDGDRGEPPGLIKDVPGANGSRSWGSRDAPWLEAGWHPSPAKPLLSPRCFCA